MIGKGVTFTLDRKGRKPTWFDHFGIIVSRYVAKSGLVGFVVRWWPMGVNETEGVIYNDEITGIEE
jgi:hypothetical protein